MTVSAPTPPSSLDHVALWVADRDALAGLLCDALGMHVVERTETFTLVGVDARLGKLTLFAAEGPRDAGVLERVVLRVDDVEAAAARLPGPVEPDGDGAVAFAGPEGLGLGLVATRDGQRGYDLDHVVLRVPDPADAGRRLARLGFEHGDGDELRVGDRSLRLVEGRPAPTERPLLNHLALLVDSADEHLAHARRHGVETDEIKDAPNTYAGFVTGPDGIRIEYVEHKPTFSLV